MIVGKTQLGTTLLIESSLVDDCVSGSATRSFHHFPVCSNTTEFITWTRQHLSDLWVSAACISNWRQQGYKKLKIWHWNIESAGRWTECLNIPSYFVRACSAFKVVTVSSTVWNVNGAGCIELTHSHKHTAILLANFLVYLVYPVAPRRLWSSWYWCSLARFEFSVL